MTFKLPNFLIAGAAKCGTSSLYYHLRGHPQVYMSSIKEPHHFSTQNLDINFQGVGDHRRTYVKDFDAYCKYFEDVKDEIAIGEASPDTMYTWKTSIPYLKSKIGEPKIILILRNPVDRAYSAYLHLIRENRETLSFEDGLAKEDERISKNWQALWHYKHTGMYYQQVKALLENFSQVKIFLTEDYNIDTSGIVRQACEFLGVSTDYESPYTEVRYNTSGVPRSMAINHLFVMKNPLQRFVRKIGHTLMTEDGWIAFRDTTRAKLMVKPKMRPETKESLKLLFREDILNLQELIQRDLSIWLNK